MRNNKMKGFTLVELLVVIAILAILATVSVVGYTSYIKNAEISNDQNLAGQLNQFSAAINADHTSDFHNTAITPENVWAVTNEIRELGGLDEIVPSALKYGHLYFRFDKDEDGNYVGGEYVFVEDKDIKNYGMHIVLKAFGLVPNERPGFFEGNDGNLYFLIDTAGSNLAEAVRGFYTFDHIEGTNKFDTFQNIVSKLGAEHQNIKDAAQNSVFVTTEGTVAAGESATGYVFHTESNLVMGESVTVTITTTVTIPSNVTTVQIGALDVVVEEGGSIVFEASAEELQNVLSDEFITEGTTFEVDGQEFILTDGANDGANAGTAVITPKADNDTTEYPLACSNYLADFDIFVDDTNKSYLSKQTNALNIPYVVWHTGSVELSLDPDSLKANDESSPLSSSRVTWKLTDENGNAATYTGVTLDNGVLTFSKDGNMYPNHSSIWVTATSVYPKGGENNATHTFEIKLSRGTGMAVTVDGNSATEVLWGEDASEDDGLKNSYTIGATLNAWANKVSDNFTYDDDVVLDESSDVLTVNGTTVETATNILSGNTANTTISFDVIVGGYYKETVTLTLNHARVLYKIKNTDIKYIGTEGATVSASDLFTIANGATAPTGEVKVNAYLEATAGTSMSNLKPLPIGSSTNQAVYAEGDANANSVALSNGTFNLGLKSKTNTATPKVVFVVTVDGVRASENYEVTVVNGTNAKDYATLDASGNNVLLSDIRMSSGGSFTIASGKYFYGNCFTFNIEDGIITGKEGVITLSGHLRDTRIVGRIFPDLGLQIKNDYGTNAVKANGGSTIDNCYISNCRAPLRSSGSVTVSNTVLFGGRYCNIDITSGKLTLSGDVITVNQPYQNVVGTGINEWLNSSDVSVDISNCNLTQYNFVPESIVGNGEILPSMNIAGIIDVNLDKMFAGIFGLCVRDVDWKHDHSKNCCSSMTCLHTGLKCGLDTTTYSSFYFTDDAGVRYVHPSFLSIKLGASSGVNIGSNSGDYENKTYSYSGYNLFITALTPTKLGADSTLFEDSMNAQYKFSPNSDTVGSETYGEYDFLNGSILPQGRFDD